VVGTLSFMPPEQALSQRIDHRADLYALAVTLYVAVSGRRPFDGTPAAILDGVLHEPPPSLGSFGVDKAFEAILMKALQKNPIERYASAAEMARAIELWRSYSSASSAEERSTSTLGGLVYDSELAPPSRSRGNRPRVGAMFGRYKITALLGAGAVGEVFCAEDTEIHGRTVALKTLHVACYATEEGLTMRGASRILREARLAASLLSHPNAVRVYDVSERHRVPYLVMEMVPGKSLRHFIGDTAIAIDERVRWITDVARALAGAHAKGLVHRDIKPENVIVRAEDHVIKVVDFGIARRIFEHDIFERLEATEHIAGTPAYMAPEQMHGASGHARSDQFSWAVLAYELLAGKLPWVQRGSHRRCAAFPSTSSALV